MGRRLRSVQERISIASARTARSNQQQFVPGAEQIIPFNQEIPRPACGPGFSNRRKNFNPRENQLGKVYPNRRSCPVERPKYRTRRLGDDRIVSRGKDRGRKDPDSDSSIKIELTGHLDPRGPINRPKPEVVQALLDLGHRTGIQKVERINGRDWRKQSFSRQLRKGLFNLKAKPSFHRGLDLLRISRKTNQPSTRVFSSPLKINFRDQLLVGQLKRVRLSRSRKGCRQGYGQHIGLGTMLHCC